VTLTAGSLLKSMIPKKVNGDRANGTS
jgi:hypothetical protein